MERTGRRWRLGNRRRFDRRKRHDRRIWRRGSHGRFDSKFVGLGPLLRQEAEHRAGCAVSIFINTHHHGDHTGGNLAFSGGTDMLAHAAAARRISESWKNYQQQVETAEDAANRLGGEDLASAATLAFNAAASRAADISGWMPTRTVNAYPMHLEIGERAVAVQHFGPGHTDNDLVIHLPDLNVVHCGDLFFNGRHPYFDPNGGVSAAGWSRSLRLTLELCDGATIVVPGHGPVGDKAALSRQLGYMESIIEEVGKAGRSGMSREEVTAMSWPFMDGLGAENLKGRAIAAVYDELFPGR